MTDAKLDFWIQHNFNVLFIGKHGVGKTARIIDAFVRNKLKWKYFSTSTLDPWVDFVGVPKEVIENGNSYLELVRPKFFAEDQIEAIFLDEYNRSPQKVRNATMELIQFKSINGKKFNNLKIVWAAINPEKKDDESDEPEYDVNKLDPAQIDRFPVHVNVPYKPDLAFFKHKFGHDVARACTQWWTDLTDKEKESVSPRRLDYAMEMFGKKGDIRDVLPSNVNVNKLINELKNGSYRERMEAIFTSRNIDDARSFLTEENNYNNTIKYIAQEPEKLEFFFPLLSEEKQMANLINNSSVQTYVFEKRNVYEGLLEKGRSNVELSKKYANFLKVTPIDLDKIQSYNFNKMLIFTPHPTHPTQPEYTNIPNYLKFLKEKKTPTKLGTTDRYKIYNTVMKIIYNDYGYKKYSSPTFPLCKADCESILEIFNEMISVTHGYITMTSYTHFVELYGTVCREYLLKHNRKQMYSNLHRRVQEFLNAHSIDFQ